MNMQISALREQHERYKAIRAKLWGAKPAKPAIEIAPPAKPVRTLPPLWSCIPMEFDAHVISWRDSLEYQDAILIEASDEAMAFTPRRSAKQIVAEVLIDFPGVTWDDLKGSHRTKDIVYPRQLAMFEIFRQRKDMSFPQIGRLFGNRDHTTVLHAVRKIEAMGEAEREAAIIAQRRHIRRLRGVAREGSLYAQQRIAEINGSIE